MSAEDGCARGGVVAAVAAAARCPRGRLPLPPRRLLLAQVVARALIRYECGEMVRVGEGFSGEGFSGEGFSGEGFSGERFSGDRFSSAEEASGIGESLVATGGVRGSAAKAAAARAFSEAFAAAASSAARISSSVLPANFGLARSLAKATSSLAEAHRAPAVSGRGGGSASAVRGG